MLATFIQRWARRYIRITQSSRYSPHKRARLRAFFFSGVERWHVSWAVEALPTLLHLSLFLFFVGLVIYLSNTNHTVFGFVVWWVVLSMMVYLCITLLPFFRPNSPYYAPLSSILWFLYVCLSCAVSKGFSSPVFRRFGFSTTHDSRGSRIYRKRFSEDIRKTAEETTLVHKREIDFHVLESTFDSLGEDGAWERFFEAIPGFFDSELVTVKPVMLPSEFRDKFCQALNGFLDCTFSLSSVTESIMSNRLAICLNAAHAALGSESSDAVSQILQDIRSGRWPELLQSVEIGHSLRRWRNSNDELFTENVRRIMAQIVVGVRERDSRWLSLVKAEYGIEEPALRKYSGHGDSVLLSILIHMIREAFHTRSWTPWVLWSLSEFNIRDTSLELQHAFCALWNDIVLEALNQGPIEEVPIEEMPNEEVPNEERPNKERPTNIPVQILRHVRRVYIALHQGADATLTASSAFPYHFDPVLDHPRSYRVCSITGHRQNLSIRTPVSGSFNPATQLNRSPATSPLHSSPKESDHTPDNSTAAQQREETDIMVTVEPPSSTDDTPYLSSTRRFTSSLLGTNSVCVTQPEATPVTGSSVPESNTCDPCLFPGPGVALHEPCQSAPSAGGIATTHPLRSNDPMTSIHASESGETSEAFVAPPLIFQHLDAVPATIALSTGLDPSDDSDALRATPSSATPIHPLGGNKTVAPCGAPDASEISSTINLIPPSTHSVSPTVVVSECPSPIPVHPSSMTSGEPPSFVKAAPIQFDHILDALRSWSSSPTTGSSHISPQVTSAFDVQITLRIGTPSPHDETHNLNPPIPMTVLLHLAKPTSPADDIVAPTLQPGDQVHYDLDK